MRNIASRSTKCPNPKISRGQKGAVMTCQPITLLQEYAHKLDSTEKERVFNFDEDPRTPRVLLTTILDLMLTIPSTSFIREIQ
jgi:hypothetical protein